MPPQFEDVCFGVFGFLCWRSSVFGGGCRICGDLECGGRMCVDVCGSNVHLQRRLRVFCGALC